MRILMVCEPGVDGVFRHVEGLSRFLATRGHDLCVAYSTLRDSEGLYSFLDWLTNNDFPGVDLKTGSFPSVRDVRSVLALRDAIRKFKPEVIHAHSSKAGGLVRLFMAPSVPVVYTPHAYYGLGGGRSPLNSIFNSVERWLARRSTNVHLSPGETQFAQQVLGISGAAAVEIPNPVDFDHFKPPASTKEKLAIRKQLDIEPDSLVIGTIGRICYQKNHEFLYQAFAHLLDRTPDKITLMHVGTGKQKDEQKLLRLAQELKITARLVRPEYQSDPRNFYQAMDVFALTSRYEGLPLTALEALATNLPLVVCNSPGLVTFGDYELSHIFVAEAGSPADLAEKMETSLRSLEETVSNRETAKKFFSIESCYGRIEDLYQQLVLEKAR